MTKILIDVDKCKHARTEKKKKGSINNYFGSVPKISVTTSSNLGEPSNIDSATKEKLQMLGTSSGLLTWKGSPCISIQLSNSELAISKA